MVVGQKVGQMDRRCWAKDLPDLLVPAIFLTNNFGQWIAGSINEQQNLINICQYLPIQRSVTVEGGCCQDLPIFVL